MTLTLHYHPLSSYCWKVLIALYENATGFERVIVDLGDPASAAAFKALWPLAKMPALRDEARGETMVESTIVIEYLDRYYRGPAPMIPADPAIALGVRFLDRFFDNYLQGPLQQIVGDRIRPEGCNRDPYGVAAAHGKLRDAYDELERRLGRGSYAAGEAFTLADCAACPAIFYADKVEPIGDRPKVAAYLARLTSRPSFRRVLEEAEPYFKYFPA